MRGVDAVFTGIVEELGEVVALDRRGDSAELVVRGPLAVSDAGRGGSIAVDGCCLTVVSSDETTFRADVMRESLARTTLGRLTLGSRVNLERPVRLADRLGGHLVQGHVDGVAEIVERVHAERWDEVTVLLSEGLAAQVALKGSIALDGVSLTVSGVGHLPRGETATVSLIPETLRRTTFGIKNVGDEVNVETDVIAKYVQRLTELAAQPVGDVA